MSVRVGGYHLEAELWVHVRCVRESHVHLDDRHLRVRPRTAATARDRVRSHCRRVRPHQHRPALCAPRDIRAEAKIRPMRREGRQVSGVAARLEQLLPRMRWGWACCLPHGCRPITISTSAYIYTSSHTPIEFHLFAFLFLFFGTHMIPVQPML